jgi:hypothetical protein
MHTCKKLEPIGQLKSQSSHFQPQLGIKQPDHADYVKVDVANVLKNLPMRFVDAHTMPATFQIAQLASPRGFHGV